MSRAKITNKIHRALSRSRYLLRVIVKIRNQCNAIIGCSVGESTSIEQNGESLLIRALAPTAKYFIDVGANVGSWSQEFTRLMPPSGQGLAFEPSTPTFEALQHNLAVCPNIELVQSALGDKVGQIKFLDNSESSELSHVAMEPFASSLTEGSARISTIDSELAARNWPQVDVLKIDTEGYDYLVLKGATEALRQAKLGVIQFEYNAPWRETSSTLRSAILLLEAFQYKVYLLRSTGLHAVNYDCLGEYFSYSNYVAVSPRSARLLGNHTRAKFL
jgi:FkbM family methyltransferase